MESDNGIVVSQLSDDVAEGSGVELIDEGKISDTHRVSGVRTNIVVLSIVTMLKRRILSLQS